VVVEHNKKVNETTVEVPAEAAKKEWEKRWEQFVNEKEKIKFTEVMIQVCVSLLICDSLVTLCTRFLILYTDYISKTESCTSNEC
jgi:hypothetical protein